MEITDTILSRKVIHERRDSKCITVTLGLIRLSSNKTTKMWFQYRCFLMNHSIPTNFQKKNIKNDRKKVIGESLFLNFQIKRFL